MNSAAILAAAFPALMIVGVLLAPLFARRDRSRRYPHGPQSRHDHLGRSQVSDQRAAIGTIESRLAHEGAAYDPPAEGDQYFADWAALQDRFNEEPA
jgi:hypothetical protein